MGGFALSRCHAGVLQRCGGASDLRRNDAHAPEDSANVLLDITETLLCQAGVADEACLRAWREVETVATRGSFAHKGEVLQFTRGQGRTREKEWLYTLGAFSDLLSTEHNSMLASGTAQEFFWNCGSGVEVQATFGNFAMDCNVESEPKRQKVASAILQCLAEGAPRDHGVLSVPI